MITKGYSLDQARKLAQSELGDMFQVVETVSDKTPDIYTQAFAPCGGRDAAMMVGNCVTPDVLPAIAAGAWGNTCPMT
ncbi:hypothetical protein [Aliiroseovarius crassostreae]|uniref:hypothetical protein n=1 Tax=Aliiroseovarius crassostreae TaxID=154981 RepID=UPI003C7B3BB1